MLMSGCMSMQDTVKGADNILPGEDPLTVVKDRGCML